MNKAILVRILFYQFSIDSYSCHYARCNVQQTRRGWWMADNSQNVLFEAYVGA